MADMKEFEEMYKRYFSDVYRYMLRLSHSEDIAQEITSNTFFKAMKSIDSFRGECNVRVWLCQIAKNCYYTYLKKHSKISGIDDENVFIPFDDSTSVEDKAEIKDEASRIQAILHDLPEPYREVFMWRVYADLDFKQIAQIFSKTDNWACVTYHRARKMIKDRLEEQENEK